MRAAGTVRPIATATANIENSTTTTPSANRFCPDVGGSVANTSSGSTTLRGANNASVLWQGYRPTNFFINRKVSKIRCSCRPCQHLRVGHARRNDFDPHDIVTSCHRGGDRRGRKILVGEKTQNQAALGNTFSELSVSRA